jgi:anti-sigma factor RsiW
MREWTSAALDGALASNDSTSYFVHLQSCPPCRLHHEEMRTALALLSELPPVEVSDTFEDRVWTLIAEDRQAREQRWALPSWLRSFSATPAWMGWSFAGVSAAVVALALVSSDPAPLATIAHRATNPMTEQVIASAPTAVPVAEKTAVEAEEEFVADMPEAIRVYLQQGGQDLRLSDSAERYRRSNYTYPVRRVVDPDPFRLTGESQNPSPAGSDQDGTVIQF